MSPLTGLTTKDCAFLGGSPLRLECFGVVACRSLRSSNGDLDASEFVDGCMRLKGPARSIDVSLLLQEQRRIRKKIVSALIESLWHIYGSKDSMDNGLICKQYLLCVHMYWLNNLPNVVFFPIFSHDP